MSEQRYSRFLLPLSPLFPIIPAHHHTTPTTAFGAGQLCFNSALDFRCALSPPCDPFRLDVYYFLERQPPQSRADCHFSRGRRTIPKNYHPKKSLGTVTRRRISSLSCRHRLHFSSLFLSFFFARQPGVFLFFVCICLKAPPFFSLCVCKNTGTSGLLVGISKHLHLPSLHCFGANSHRPSSPTASPPFRTTRLYSIGLWFDTVTFGPPSERAYKPEPRPRCVLFSFRPSTRQPKHNTAVCSRFFFSFLFFPNRGNTIRWVSLFGRKK